MNKSELVKKIEEKKTFIHDDVKLSIVSLISETLRSSGRVEIRNFGTFSTRSRNKRISRNPKTGSTISVPTKSHPYFRASKFLKETLSDAPSLNQEQYQNLLSFIESKRGKKITTRLKRTHKHDK